MRLLGVGEFRFKETKVSSRGNSYLNLVFEDTDRGDQIKAFVKMDAVLTVPADKLVKGQKYLVFFNRYYDYGKQQFDLVDICSYSEKIHNVINGAVDG